MHYDFVDWDHEDDANGNTRHIAHNGVTQEEFMEILDNARERDIKPSRSSGRPSVSGETSEGRELFIVFERTKQAGMILIRPITAYDA